jgi:GR25 family glycosyltransferase involved in LPS biosynthesis
MTTLNDYFDRIILINLARRTDRWEHAKHEFWKHNVKVERFLAFDMPGDENRGCTESHAAVLRMIVERGWSRTLILEDDVEFRFDDTQQRFSDMIKEVPFDWFMLYLGGHHGAPLKRFVAPHVVQIEHMKTTSSYAVTLEAATEMAPRIHGAGPIDELYYLWNQTRPSYCFEPRLAVQYENFSDIQQRVMNNALCMEDESHVEKLRGQHE